MAKKSAVRERIDEHIRLIAALGVEHPEHADMLSEIVCSLQSMSEVMFEPSIRVEKRALEALEWRVRQILGLEGDVPEPPVAPRDDDLLLLGFWVFRAQMRSSSSTNMLTNLLGAAATLGAGNGKKE